MSNEELVSLYQNGDKQALDKIIEQNMGIVYKLANKFYVKKSNSIDIDDLVQEGVIGLILAADKYKFNVENPCKFITYAVYWVYQKIQRFVKTKNTNSETSLYTPIGEKDDAELIDLIKDEKNNIEALEEKLYIKQLRKELDQVMDKYLTLKEREIIKLKYGWDNNKCTSNVEIAQVFNIIPSTLGGVLQRSYMKMWRTPWGQRKAKEMFEGKYNVSNTDANKAIEMIDFCSKYII